MQQKQGLIDRTVDVERNPFWVQINGDVADPLDHVARAVCIPNDVLNSYSGLGKLRWISSKPAQRGLCVRNCGGEWLVNLMRDRGGQFAEHGDARHARQVALRLLSFRLGDLAVCYIIVSWWPESFQLLPLIRYRIVRPRLFRRHKRASGNAGESG